VKLRNKIKTAAKARFRRKVTTPAKRAIRREVRRRPLFTCGACGKQYNNPLGHVCGNRGDFGKRKRARQRAEQAEARKQKRAAERQRVSGRIAAARQSERDRAAQRVSATGRRERARADARVAKARAACKPARRAGRPAHDYIRCRDHDCQRPACEAYREGVADGMDAEA
jgi:hypothetical protein